MSLRVRLVLTIASIVLLGLAAAGGLAWRHARQTVRTEMVAAITVGRGVAANALAEAGGETTATAAVARIVSTFDHDRHLRASLLAADGVVLAASMLQSPPEPAPEWFVRLLSGAEPTARIELTSPTRTLVLVTDPTNEIGEVWGELTVSGSVMTVLGGITILLVYWSLGRALAPLDVLSHAFLAVGSHDYSTTVAETGAPELARLARGFNAMASRLAAAEIRSRRLDEQISAIQEEERAELARDLHDDVGPYLLAINIDASRIARLAAAADDREVATLVRSIQDGTQHIQKQVRAILSRLRPAGLEELGLVPALQALAVFWRSRHPEIAIAIDAQGVVDLGPALDDAIYRIVRESVGNAIRHGKPSLIIVSIVDVHGQTQVSIADDGGGLASVIAGFGLRGMNERVRSLGGTLAVTNRIAPAGVMVDARLPHASSSPADTLMVRA